MFTFVALGLELT